MFRKSWILAIAGALLMAGAAVAGTFGTVIAIGGQSADVALDESRGVLYIANLTANRIDVMSLATNRVQTSMNVAAQPASISLSPDNHWLLVAHFGNNVLPSSPTNALTLIDLTANNAKQVFALANPPLGVVFGLDDKALVITTQEFILFDPALGTTQLLTSVANVTANTLPVPLGTPATTITSASVAASADGLHAYGMGSSTGTFTFRYDVATHTITPGSTVNAVGLKSSNPSDPLGGVFGPRAVSMDQDGSNAIAGWVMVDRYGTFINNFQPTVNQYSVGTSAFDSLRGLVYAQMPTTASDPPTLQILDSDNLTLRDRLQLPENTTGKSVITSDSSVMYSVSASGVLVLPVGNLNNTRRLAAQYEDMVFLGSYCDRGVQTQTLTITDPGGGSTPFTITSRTPGLTVSPSSGVTPATVRVMVDPNAFQNQKGTVIATLTLSSSSSVNVPPPVRVLINSQQPSQRGTLVNVPGKVVDLLADPVRNQYYVLRQDRNQVSVYDGANNTLSARLRTYNEPTSMATTLDGRYLLVGHVGSQTVAVYDLETNEQMPYISTSAGNGNTVRSIAVATNVILASTVDYLGVGHIVSIDLGSRVATQLPTLGVFVNVLDPDTVLTASANGSKVLVASKDGNVLLYDANVGSFTVSRKDFNSLGGSYAASVFSQYVVGNNLLDASLVPVGTLQTASGNNPSGFAFVNQTSYRTLAPSPTSPGVIEQVDLASGASIGATSTVEAPILGASAPSSSITNSCTTVTTGTTITTTCTVGTLVTTQACSTVSTGGTTTSTCTSSSGSNAAPPAPYPTPSFWTRSLAPLPNQTAIISLSTSGFTVLPWAYAASVAPPQISKIVSAADGTSPIAPGGLMSVYGTQLSPTNLATSQIPLPTALANSCLTVNGQPVPIIFVSPNQINAQMPAIAIGDVTMVVQTPGGVSDNFNLTVLPTAPAVFLSGVAGPEINLPTVIRAENNLLVTDSNPIHRNDTLVIYLTGCGQTTPGVGDGLPAPSGPYALVLNAPDVELAGTRLPVVFAGLAPGQVGVCQINATVPRSVATGLSMPLSINQGGFAKTLRMRVVN